MTGSNDSDTIIYFLEENFENLDSQIFIWNSIY